MFELNKIHNIDCIEGLKQLDDASFVEHFIKENIMSNTQEIKANITHRARWLMNILNLYWLYSNKDDIQTNALFVVFDSELKDLIKTLEIGLGSTLSYQYNDMDKGSLYSSDLKNVVVCFSGGKDSVAVALKYKEMGYNVYLYHIQGINKVYTDEYLRAQEMAKKLDLPLYIEKISLVGNNSYLEHPLKNQVVCSLALNYAITNNLGTNIAFGDFTDDNVSEGLFDRNWSDTQEMWLAYTRYIKNYVPTFELKTPFNNYLETLDIVASSGLLPFTQGCLSPQRFKAHLHESNQEKYGVELMPNRCGSCWKCCVEYIFLVDKGYVNPNKDFYVHCLELLKRKMKEEKPQLPKPNNYEDVYKAYIPQGFDSSYLVTTIMNKVTK